MVSRAIPLAKRETASPPLSRHAVSRYPRQSHCCGFNPPHPRQLRSAGKSKDEVTVVACRGRNLALAIDCAFSMKLYSRPHSEEERQAPVYRGLFRPNVFRDSGLRREQFRKPYSVIKENGSGGTCDVPGFPPPPGGNTMSLPLSSCKLRLECAGVL